MGSKLIKERERGTNPERLTDQQLVFIHELAADHNFNAAEAARKAGYANPVTQAGRLLKTPKIAAALGKVLKQRMDRLEMTADRVLEEVAYCALRDPLDLCDENGLIITDDLSKIPERMRRCIDGIKVHQTTDKQGNVEQTIEYKLVGKIAALDLAMKHLGLHAPTQQNVKVSLDWDSLYQPMDEPDEIEAKIIEVQNGAIHDSGSGTNGSLDADPEPTQPDKVDSRNGNGHAG